MTETDDRKPKAWDGAPPNYTQVPNALFDLAMRDMGAAELKIVLAVIRKTIGWHKQRDVISLSQLEEMTGLTRYNVVRGVREAAKNGWIRHYKAGRISYYELALREKIDSDSTAAVLGTDSPAAVLPMVLQQYQDSPVEVPQVVPQEYPQKKGKKETKKEKENSPARAARGGVDSDPSPVSSSVNPDQPAAESRTADPAKPARKAKRTLDEHEAQRHRELFEGLVAVCVVDVKLMGGRIARTAKQLREADASATRATMDEFLSWWKTSDFRGIKGKPPTLDQVLTCWKLFRENYAERPAAQPISGKRAPMTVDRIKASLDF